MTYHSDIFNAIKNNATIAGIVGTRIFADVADGTAAAPYLTFQFISTSSENTHDTARGLDITIIQLNCWASSKAGAVALADAVDSLFAGQNITGDSLTTAQFSNRFGTYESDTKLFGELLEFRATSNHN